MVRRMVQLVGTLVSPPVFAGVTLVDTALGVLTPWSWTSGLDLVAAGGAAAVLTWRAALEYRYLEVQEASEAAEVELAQLEAGMAEDDANFPLVQLSGDQIEELVACARRRDPGLFHELAACWGLPKDERDYLWAGVCALVKPRE